MPLDPTPVPTGPEFRVDAATAPFHYNPAATALVDGGFVVVRDTFSSAKSSNKAEYQRNYLSSDVYAQFYDADGTPTGGEFRVNDHLAGYQGSPKVAALADGGFAVTWESAEPGERSTLQDVRARRFDADGAPVGSEVQLLSGRDEAPEIAALANGGFVVAWAQTYGGQTDLPGCVYVQLFGADGAPAGGAVRADAASAGFYSFPKITALAGGGFVVAWVQPNLSRDVGGTDVYARRFGADGTPAGEGFRVHVSDVGDQGGPAVAALADGGFVVTWTSDAEHYIITDVDATDVHARRFTADGVPVGGEFRVHDATDGYQWNPGAWVLADGRFAVTWFGPEGRSARFFEAPGLSGPPAMLSRAEIVAGVVSQDESDSGTTAFTFDITLDAAPSAPQSLRWHVEGTGANRANPIDFEGGALAYRTLTFAAGETRKTITVLVAGDEEIEPDEGFAVWLSDPSPGLVLATPSAAATILDDDMAASALPAHAAKVARLYDAALDRSPDRGGFEFWVNALGKGEALSSLASGFLASEESAARFGDASADDAAFVERLYQNVLGRAGEAEGRAFWGDSLGKGCSRAEVLAAFSESAEHVALTADLYGEGAGLLIA